MRIASEQKRRLCADRPRALCRCAVADQIKPRRRVPRRRMMGSYHARLRCSSLASDIRVPSGDQEWIGLLRMAHSPGLEQQVTASQIADSATRSCHRLRSLRLQVPTRMQVLKTRILVPLDRSVAHYQVQAQVYPTPPHCLASIPLLRRVHRQCLLHHLLFRFHLDPIEDPLQLC